MKLALLRAWLTQLQLSVQFTSKSEKHANENDGGQGNGRELLAAKLDIHGKAKEKENQNTDYLSVVPQEILIYLIDFLTYPDVLTFRLVSVRFHDIIPASSLSKHHTATASLIYSKEVETRGAHNIEHHNGAHGTPWSNCLNKRECLAINNSNLTCYHCYQWLFPGRFTNGMSHGSYSLGMLSAKNRLCMECGVRTGLYGKGACVGFYGAVCLDCGKLFRTRSTQSRAEGCYERWCRVCAPDRGTQFRKWKNHLEEEHLRQYLEYLARMQRGKKYRDQKGEKWRRERDIRDNGGNPANKVDVVEAIIDGQLILLSTKVKLDDGSFQQKRNNHWLASRWCCLMRAHRWLSDAVPASAMHHLELDSRRLPSYEAFSRAGTVRYLSL